MRTITAFLLLACAFELTQSSKRFVLTFQEGQNALEMYKTVLQPNIQSEHSVDKWYGRRIILRFQNNSEAQAFWHAVPSLQEAVPSLRMVEEDNLIQEASITVSASNVMLNDTKEKQPQWNLEMLGIHKKWSNLSTFGEKSIVAVLDSGIAVTALGAFGSHGERVIGGYDFISDDSLAMDGDARDANFYDPGDADEEYCPGQFSPSWHGTKVASVLAANFSGYLGVTPAARILPVRVLGRCKMGYASDVADGIVWAAGGTINGIDELTSRANVIVMAFGGVGLCPSFMQTAVDLAIARNVTLLAAAGNNPNLEAENYFPGNCRGVISVGALNANGQVASYSAKRPKAFMPGGDAELPVPCLGADLEVDVQNCVGTSMAVPHAAGLVALHVSLMDEWMQQSAKEGREWPRYLYNAGRFVEGMVLQNYMALDVCFGFTLFYGVHVCVVVNDGTLKCRGNNHAGQLGDGTRTDSADFLTISLGSGNRAKAVACGTGFTCALMQDDNVKCWGSNWHGQLGNGNRDDVLSASSATVINFGTGLKARQIACGSTESCAILNDGSQKCWGNNQYNQLGVGSSISMLTSPAAASDIGQGRIAVGMSLLDNMVCTLLDNGSVICRGRDYSGNSVTWQFSNTLYHAMHMHLGVGQRVFIVYSNAKIYAEHEMTGDNIRSNPLRVISTQFIPCALLQTGNVDCYNPNVGPITTFTSASIALGNWDLLYAIRSDSSLVYVRTSNLGNVFTESLSTYDAPCLPGFINPSGTTCTACAAGSYSTAGSFTACTSCEAGKYVSTTGKSACTLCAAGKSSTVLGASSATVCSNCIAGTYSYYNGSSSCMQCKPGTYSDAGSQMCTMCGAGTYLAASGESQCLQCTAGKYTSSQGSTECLTCTGNSYSAVGSSSCTLSCSGDFQMSSGHTGKTYMHILTYTSRRESAF